MGMENLEFYEATPDEGMGVTMQSSGKNFELIYQAVLHELKGEYADAARGYESYLDSTGLQWPTVQYRPQQSLSVEQSAW